MFVIGFPLLLPRLQTKYSLAKVLFFVCFLYGCKDAFSAFNNRRKTIPIYSGYNQSSKKQHCALHSVLTLTECIPIE